MKTRQWMALALLAFAPAAFAVDGGTLVGGAIGAGAGAVIGQKLKGKDGAVAGAVIGGAVGAIIGSNQGYGYPRMMGPGPRGPGPMYPGGPAGVAAEVRGGDGYYRYEGDGDRGYYRDGDRGYYRDGDGGYYRGRHDRGHHYGERRREGDD